MTRKSALDCVGMKLGIKVNDSLHFTIIFFQNASLYLYVNLHSFNMFIQIYVLKTFACMWIQYDCHCYLAGLACVLWIRQLDVYFRWVNTTNMFLFTDALSINMNLFSTGLRG